MATGSRFHRAVSLLLALLVGLTGSGLLSVPAKAQSFTYSECRGADEAALRAELEEIGQQVVAKTDESLSIEAIVERKWNEQGVSAVYDAEVEAAIARLKDESSYWNRFISGWWPDKAETLATQTISYTFESPVLQAKLEELSTAIAEELVRESESILAQAASSALLCLQAYVGEQYSGTLFLLFQSEIAGSLNVEAGMVETPKVDVLSAAEHPQAAIGAGVVVASTTAWLVQPLVTKIVQRLAGKIVARVAARLGSAAVPIAGWIIGAGLIIWDIWDGFDGALPQIRSALQSEEVKAQIRDEIVASTRAGLDEELAGMAGTLAARLVQEWGGFCERYAHLCTLSQTSPRFRSVLDLTPLEDMADLSLLVDTFLAHVGQEELVQAVNSGVFQVLMRLQPEAATMLAVTGSPQVVLEWANLTGGDLQRVVQLSLHESHAPEEFDAPTLQAILSLEDDAVVARLFQMKASALKALAALPADRLLSLVNQASDDDLAWLSDYLAAADAEMAQMIVQEFANGAQTVAALRGSSGNAMGEIGATDAVSVALAAGAMDERSEGSGASILEGSREPLWYESNVLMAIAVVVFGLLLLVAVKTILGQLPTRHRL